MTILNKCIKVKGSIKVKGEVRMGGEWLGEGFRKGLGIITGRKFDECYGNCLGS